MLIASPRVSARLHSTHADAADLPAPYVIGCQTESY